MRTKAMTIAALTAVLTLTALTPASADFFPAQEGNYWIFSYTRTHGGWGQGETDSGTIRWDITSIDILESNPVQLRIHIRQTDRLLQRRTFGGGVLPNAVANDTVIPYNPPLYSIDSLVLRGLGGVSGLWFEGDSCWSFLHDTSSVAIAGHVALTLDTMTLRGPLRRTVRVDPTPCRASGNPLQASCLEPDYFTCANGVGPVAYTKSSSPCLMDAYSGESWRLITYDTKDTGAMWDGGPCSYDRYPSTARITRISPVSDDSADTRYEAYFIVDTMNIPANVHLPWDLSREYGFSQVDDAAKLIPQLHLKTGHVYPCTLSVTAFGTCSPGRVTFGVPRSWQDYDTSPVWIEPSSVRANSPSTIHLLGNASPFNCNTIFDSKWVGYPGFGITLAFNHSLIINDTLRQPGPYLYGTPFRVNALDAGGYPIYMVQNSPECNVCGAPLPRLIDTLLVTPQTAVTMHVASKSIDAHLSLFRTASGLAIRLPVTSAGPVTVNIHDARGALLGSARNVQSVGRVAIENQAPGTWFVTILEGNRIIARQRITSLSR